MINKTVKDVKIQASYKDDKVYVQQGNHCHCYTFKQVEAINGCMEAEYISNNLPKDDKNKTY